MHSADVMVVREIRHAMRALLRVPGLTAISVLTVMLGVGAGTALFSVVKAVLLNPLPYSEPSSLAWLAEVNDNGKQIQVAYQNYLDWRSQTHSFSTMAAYEFGPAIVAGGSVPQGTYGAAVTPDFFTVLRANAAIGRTFTPEEAVVGGRAAVVLGYGVWQSAFGGDRSVIGRAIRISGLSLTVVGVMPQGFGFPEKAGIWVPVTVYGDPGINVRTGHNFRVIGRLKPGATMDGAQAEIDGIEGRIKRQYPSPFQCAHAGVVSLRSHLVGEVRRPLLMLLGAVGFVLLIVCVNIANLLLVRATSRARELAVRTALGAGRGRLIRQMLVESVLLAVAGGVCGLVLAAWSMDLLRTLLPADMPRAGDVGMDAGVVVFALIVSLACGLLFGLLPAWRASVMNVSEALKAGSRSATAGKRSQRIQAALVISEACLSLVLVAGAGLLARSFWNLRSVDPGFHSDHVLAVNSDLETQGEQSLVPRYRALLERVRAIPGVQSAATVSNLPIEGDPDGHFFIASRRAQTANADANYSIISPGYLKTMGIPLLRGRDFTDQDTETSQPVAIITSEMARVYFPNRDPIGERVWFDSFTGAKEHWATIVGIAGDVRQSGLTHALFAQAYTCYTQQTFKALLNDGNLVIRTAVAPASMSSSARAAVRAVNPDAAPLPRTMDSVLASSVSKQRFQMELLASFAVLALLLAAIGLYGVLSHMVTASRVEIGIRLALGASRPLIFRMVAGRALALAASGVLAGLLGCIAVRGVLAALLFGIGPSDPLTIASAVAVLLIAALAAAWLPARRATRVDPIAALRDE